MNIPEILLLLNLACAWYMTGVIWFVQLITYPLFRHVGVEAFCDYHARHVGMVGRVVVGPMLIELITGGLLLAIRPSCMPMWSAWVTAGLLGVVWVNTFAMAVPAHARLREGYDAGRIARVVRVNWVRTLAWTGRAGLLLWVSGRCLLK